MTPNQVSVLALTAEAFGGRGGIAQSTRDLLLAMSEMPQIGRIDVLPRLQPELVGDLPRGIYQLPPIKSRTLYTLCALWLAVINKPQIVYCGHAFMAPTAWLAARVAGASLITHVHGLEVWEPMSWTKRRTLAFSNVVLCVSKYTLDKVVEVTKVDVNRCSLTFNTVNERFFPGDRSAARQKLGIKNDAVVISTVSRLDPSQRHKGHEKVIRLLRGLAMYHANLTYLVVGTGEDRGRLEALAFSEGVAEMVRFCGFVSDEDLPDVYRASDLYVMPSHGEGFGIVFVEAMACGTPALGLDLGGAGDALRNGKLGHAVAEADFPAALHDLLLRSSDDPYVLSNDTRAVFGKSELSFRLSKAISSLLTRPRSADTVKRNN